jgi:hypothetical protein
MATLRAEGKPLRAIADAVRANGLKISPAAKARGGKGHGGPGRLCLATAQGYAPVRNQPR